MHTYGCQLNENDGEKIAGILDEMGYIPAPEAREADLIIVEGVMGLFDGSPSTADIAQAFGLPVLAVIDAAAMAQSFGAVALGLASYRPGPVPPTRRPEAGQDESAEPRSGEPPSPPPGGGGRGVSLEFHGFLANRVGSPGHAALLRDSLPPELTWRGAVPREPEAALPARHLGLLPAAEIDDLLRRLDRLADRLAETGLAELPPPVAFAAPAAQSQPGLLAGRRIAIARDAAFCFLHAANLELLRRLGAETLYFSPLAGDGLPPCDALWLPGGYPELHGERLAARRDLWAQLDHHLKAGRPILAECGGMMSLFDYLTDQIGRAHV